MATPTRPALTAAAYFDRSSDPEPELRACADALYRRIDWRWAQNGDVARTADGLPALALVMDPPMPDVLEHPPRAAAEPILGRHQWLAVAGLALAAYAWTLETSDLTHARSMAFSVLVFAGPRPR